MSTPDPARDIPQARRSPLSYLLLPLLLVAAGGAVYAYLYTQESKVEPIDPKGLLRQYAARLATGGAMADGFADSDGDLIADAPADAAKRLDPTPLAFTVIASDDPTEAEAKWKPFLDHLSKAVGRPVVYLAKAADGEEVRSVEQQMALMKAGQLHVTAFNTGAVPTAVGTAGFVPLFAPATAAGEHSYRMEIVVRADSPIQSPADLKGKRVALVGLSSNSGGKAPLVILKEKFGLTPEADFQFGFAGRHEYALKETKEGKYDAACVAGDIFQRQIASGAIKEGELRSIYQSSTFVPVVFGVSHAVKPELRKAIEQGFASFGFAGTSVGKLYEAQGRVKFVPVNYKTEFADVREIDAKFASLFGAK